MKCWEPCEKYIVSIFRHLKLELPTQFTALNDEKIFDYLGIISENILSFSVAFYLRKRYRSSSTRVMFGHRYQGSAPA